ncbi:Sugar transporter STL1 [Candida viswanathii]|uniref:Sugar transporter STL1 n=1 Tax=Candida viswanathii TaxID=5486 RepID=A0A367YFB0_9ASCO|nr:Sugar transporter STL1 [Candida viswanathii]
MTSDKETASLKSKESSQNEYDGTSLDQIHKFMGFHGKKLNIAVACFSGVGFLLFGFDQLLMGSLLTLPNFEETFPSILGDTLHAATLTGAVVSIYEIGCFVGALLTVYLGDKLGRIKCMFIGCVIVIIGAVLQTTAYTVTHLAIARVFTGIGTGFMTSTVPVWQAELSKASTRGKNIMMMGSLITAGIAIAYWVDFGFYFLGDNDTKGISWRIPIILQTIFPILLLTVIFKMPESPRWLISKGRTQEARVVFSAIYNLPENDPKVHDQMTEIQNAIELEAKANVGFSVRELVKQGPTRNFHRLSLACWIQIFQQITGINLITYYAGTIFEKYIHLSPFNSRILAACNGTEYFLASLFGIVFIERFGRRKLLFWGAVGQALSMMALTISTWQADKQRAENGGGTQAGIAATVFLFVFNSVFAVSHLGGAWLYPPEIASLLLRAQTNALSTSCNWIFNFLVVMITPIAFQNINYYTYTIFACINILIAPMIYIFYPETSGRTLEEMDAIFNATPVWKPWEVVKIEKNMPRRGQAQSEDVEKPYTDHLDYVEST